MKDNDTERISVQNKRKENQRRHWVKDQGGVRSAILELMIQRRSGKEPPSLEMRDSVDTSQT